MPIKPPNLDDRRYADIVREARALIPQYCPEWTNLSDADPGMTLVQLFAWMTELTIYRLNRVPDKTYVHFLNFIGEERKRARPATAPLTFALRGAEAYEIPPLARFSTRQRENNIALDFLTVDGLTVHDARVRRVMAVRGGKDPAVREVPFAHFTGHPSALSFAEGRGIQLFEIDAQDYGVSSYTPHQYFYVAHDDFRLMDRIPEEGARPGRLRIRRSADGGELSVASFFVWEYPSDRGWMPIETQPEREELMGMPEQALITSMPGIVPLDHFGQGEQAFGLPEPVAGSRWWVRGRLDYERYLAARMLADLDITWKDDRGGEERPINTWDVRASGRTLELFLQDVPPMRAGWTIRFAMVDRGLPAGKNAYLPRYRWYYRRGELWEEVPAERVRTEGTQVVLTGPMTDMATDGFNIRADRIDTVFLRGFCPDLEVDLSWMRPIELSMLSGDDVRHLDELMLDEGPWVPFQSTPVLPPMIGQKLYIGSDVFENRQQRAVLIEIDVAFEVGGEPIEEPKDKYQLQLTYRAEDNWRVVWTEDRKFTAFSFADLDEEGAKKAGRRKIRITLDPKTQLKGLARHTVMDNETTWLRLELVKANLSVGDPKKGEVEPIAVKIYGVQLGVDKSLGAASYEQPLPGPKMAQLDLRPENRRLTRLMTRATGRLSEYFPFFPFVELDEDNQSLYLQFDKPLPVGSRHTVQVRCRGEAFLPRDMSVDWEILEADDRGRLSWRRVRSASGGDEGDATPGYDLARSGVLEFSLPELPLMSRDGFWLRGRFNVPEGSTTDDIPALPPVTHVLLNTVDAVNLHTMRTERYSGLGVPNQTIELLRKPVFVHAGEGERSPFANPAAFTDMRVFVESEDGTREEWHVAREGHLLTAGKDDRLFVVDPVDGTLTFGNGIRGRMLPPGSNNVLVEVYRVVPGAQGNVAPGAVEVADSVADAVTVTNLLPATGGRDAETVDEIVRRAPSILTSRDRAVTRADFEIIAREASGEVARAACTGRMEDDGKVEIVILPHRGEEELIPDPFLSQGLRDHVSSYLKRRCLINVNPVVRLAEFLPIDISVTLRLRPNANVVQVREHAEQWVLRFLDPYDGGLDGEGWPFGGTLYAQDFARMVSDLPEIRHVVDVQLYDMDEVDFERGVPGWEESYGDDELYLSEHDLFVVRRVRIRTEESDR